MKLLDLYVENFGKLSRYSYKFKDGMNAIWSENGSGKTTLSVFIRAMFYGLNAERKQSLDENDRKKYAPWQGGRYGGSLSFSEGGKRYRIERFFGAKASDDTFRLENMDTGSLSVDYSENIGYEIFNIDAQGFERTIFLSEKNLGGAIVNDTISAKLSDLVGTDGDVGAVSGALARLEERRKYYQKRGNSGEIAVLRTKIAECDAALDNLERRRMDADQEEARITAIKASIDQLESERAELHREITLERAKRERRSHREQYSEMVRALERDKAALRELEECFAGGTPTTYEIDEARDAWREAERLRQSRRDAEAPELTELRDFFGRTTDFAEIDNAKRMAQKITEADAEIGAVTANLKFATETLEDELGGKLPDIDDITAYITALGNKNRYIPAIVFTLLIIPFILLGAFVTPYLFLGAIPFLILSVIFVIRANGVLSRAKAYISSMGISGSVEKELGALRERLLLHEASVKRDEERISSLNADIERYTRELTEYTSHYPHGKSDLSEAVSVIEIKYKRYYTLLENARQNEGSRRELDVRISFLEEKVRTFKERFGTVSRDPFEEIRTKLNSYTYAKMTIARREDECRSFREIHGISESDILAPEEGKDIGEMEDRLRQYGDRLTDLRREHAVLDREYSAAIAEIERTDEVMSAKEALVTKLSEYEENLSVILATAAMLNEASEAMTSRYIGGTKARFKHYLSTISDGEGEFTLGTDFVLKKVERGETRVAESYSRGMRDLHSFCLRMALADSLFGSELPFVILDDPFTALDSDKLERAKELLRQISREKQVVYFTCSKERMI